MLSQEPEAFPAGIQEAKMLGGRGPRGSFPASCLVYQSLWESVPASQPVPQGYKQKPEGLSCTAHEGVEVTAHPLPSIPGDPRH